MILHFFLVAAKLPFELIHNQIDGGQDIVIALVSHEVMLVFGIYQEFNQLRFIFEIDGNVDTRDAIKEMEKFFRLFPDELLRGLTEMAMPRRDFDLHRLDSLLQSGQPRIGRPRVSVSAPLRRDASFPSHV